MKSQIVSICEVLLLDLQLLSSIQKTHLLPLGSHRLLQEGQMITEQNDRTRIVEGLTLAHLLLEEGSGHRSHVLMAESQVCRKETGIADHSTVSTHFVGGRIDDPMTGKDLLGNRLRLGGELGSRKINLALDSRQIEFEEPPPLDDLGGDRILATGKGLQRNRFPSDHALQH